MTPEAAIYKLLIDDAAVSAIVGTKIYPLLAPQNKPKNYIVYNLITDLPDRILVSSAAISYCRIQIDLYAETYSGSKTLADKVRLALDGVSHSDVVTTDYTAHIQYLALTDQNDILLAPQNGGDVPTFRTSQDYNIGYSITIPTH
jgi:hypothetical protein